MSDQLTIHPKGISTAQLAVLEPLSIISGVADIHEALSSAREHLQEAKKQSEARPYINVKLAEAMVQRFELVVSKIDTCPEYSVPWLCAAMRYFVSSQDEEPDFDSPVGFEDDCEVLNACLELAGMDELKIKPEDYD